MRLTGDKVKIKPCPFCGGKASLYHVILGVYVVHCLICENRTDRRVTAKIAIAAWNRRSD